MRNHLFIIDGIGKRLLINNGVNGFFFYERDPFLIMRKMIDFFFDKKIFLSLLKNGWNF